MTTRKRARNEEGQLQGDDPTTPDVNEAWAPAAETAVAIPACDAAADLATFMGVDEPDTEKLTRATNVAMAAAAEIMGRPLPDPITHELRQGVNLLASQLLLKGDLDSPVDPATVPLVARYYFRLAAGAQG